ncbi:MAG: hypothetical protein ACRCWQ_07040, partial [Bacilli bacterium]
DKNTTSALLVRLNELHRYATKHDLPATKEEFRNASHLDQFLDELEYYIMMKSSFFITRESSMK